MRQARACRRASSDADQDGAGVTPRAGAQLQFVDYANWRDERVAARRTSPRLGSFSKAETAAPTRAPKAKDRVTQTISAGIIQSTKEIMKPPSSPQGLA